MASESTGNPSPRNPAGRTTPVLVPQGALAGRPDIPLDRTVTTVGSSDSARLHLISRTVSKSHAMLVNSGGGTYIADLASRTGVLVNGKPVADAELKTGDRVQIGKFVFRFRSPTNAPAAATSVEAPPAVVIVAGTAPVPITGRVTLIGRRETSPVALANDSAVSAAHAAIFQVEGRWAIRDLGSRTGTVVNDKTIHQQQLKFGDRIEIGSASIFFQPAKALEPEPISPEDSYTPMPVEVEPAEAVSVSQSAEPIPVESDDDVEPAMELPSAVTANDALPLEDVAETSTRHSSGGMSADISAAMPVEISGETEVTPTDDLIPLAGEPEIGEPAVEEAAADEADATPADDEPAGFLATEDTVSSDDPVAIEEAVLLADEGGGGAEPLSSGVAESVVEAFDVVDEQQPVAEPADAVETAIPLEVSDEVEQPAEHAGPSETSNDLVPAATAEGVTSAENLVEEVNGPVTTERAVAEPIAEIAFVSNNATEPSPESTSTTTESSEVAALPIVPPSPAPVAPAAVDQLPDVMFWGDPELDAEAEQAILGTPVAPATTRPAEFVPVDEVVADEAPAEASTPIAETAAPATPAPRASAETTEPLEVSPDPVIEPVESAIGPLSETEPSTEPVVDAEVLDEADIEPAGDLSEEALPAAEQANAEPHEAEVVEASVPGVAPEATAEPEPVVGTDEFRDTVIHGSHDDIVVADPPVAIPLTHEQTEAVAFDDLMAGELGLAEQLYPVTESGSAEHIATAPIPPGEDHLPLSLDNDIPTDEPDPLAAADAFLAATENVNDIGVENVTVTEAETIPGTDAENVAHTIETASPLADPPLSNLNFDPVDSSDSVTGFAVDETPIDVETVLGDEAAVPMGNFVPEGSAVISTEPQTGEISVVINEYIPGDLQSAADDAASVAMVPVSESITESLPETEELLTVEDGTAVIEGLEEISTADALPAPATAADPDAFEWLDDASAPVESVDDLILEESGETQPVAEATTPVEEVVTAAEGLSEDPHGTEDDLDFLEFGDAEPDAESDAATGTAVINAELPEDSETTTVTESHTNGIATESAEPSASTESAETPRPRTGPSLFGFDFEGGSFIGGMPLKLTVPPPAASAPPPQTPAAVFDFKSRAPSGLGGMIPPAPTRSKPAPHAAPPGTDDTQGFKRPLTPPRPAINPGVRSDAAPMSLTGLGTDSRAAWPAPPEIPPTLKEIGKSANGADTRQSPAGAKPLSLDVFSQNAASIGVEVFGGRPNPGTVPDSSETRAIEQKLAAEQTPEPVAAPQQAIPYRRSKAPLLVLMLIIFPVALFGAIFSFVPSSATIVGTLKFDNVSGQTAHDVLKSQKSLLASSGVISTAREVLKMHKVSTGITDDPAALDKMRQDPSAVTWVGADTLQVEFYSYDPPAGVKQMHAMLESLKSSDRNLDDRRASAQYALEAARTERTKAQDAIAAVDEQRKIQLQLAQSTPERSTIEQLDTDATKLNQQLADAKTARESSAAVLADLSSRDPLKPINVDTDPQVLDLQKQLSQLNDQIARSRPAGSTGPTPPTPGAAVTAATTQPADADPLVAVLQQDADRLASKLSRRREQLAADAALAPEERRLILESTKEKMSVNLAALERKEADAKVAAEQATAAADKAHKRFDDARSAGAKADDLGQHEMTLQDSLKPLVETEKQQQAALDNCYTVAAGTPIEVKQPVDLFEPQWPLWAGSSALVVLILVWLLWIEATRPAIVVGQTPAAAPLVNPPAPRSVPWPQPHQLEGLKADAAARTEDPKEYAGV